MTLTSTSAPQERLKDSPRWGYRWRGSSRKHTQSPERSSLQSASQRLAARSGNPINQMAPARHTWRWLRQLSSLLVHKNKRTSWSTTQQDGDKLTAVSQSRLTSMELRCVVERRVPLLTEEGGQVPTDCNWEHQGHADPERTFTQTHTLSFLVPHNWLCRYTFAFFDKMAAHSSKLCFRRFKTEAESVN